MSKTLHYLAAPSCIVFIAAFSPGCDKPKTGQAGDLSAISQPSSSSQTNALSSSSQPIIPNVVVSATQMLDEYIANEVGADAKYKDKQVVIDGSVSSIKKDLAGKAYITLISYRVERENILDSARKIQCYFETEDQAALVNLSKRDMVTVQGRCQGLMGNVLVGNCKIIKSSSYAEMMQRRAKEEQQAHAREVAVQAAQDAETFSSNAVSSAGNAVDDISKIGAKIADTKKQLSDAEAACVKADEELEQAKSKAIKASAEYSEAEAKRKEMDAQIMKVAVDATERNADATAAAIKKLREQMNDATADVSRLERADGESRMHLNACESNAATCQVVVKIKKTELEVVTRKGREAVAGYVEQAVTAAQRAQKKIKDAEAMVGKVFAKDEASTHVVSKTIDEETALASLKRAKEFSQKADEGAVSVQKTAKEGGLVDLN